MKMEDKVILNALGELKDKVTERGEMDAELKANLTKVTEDLLKTQRAVEELKAGQVTIDKKADDPPPNRKKIFEGKELNPFRKAMYAGYGIDTTGTVNHMNVRKALYMPRTSWNPKTRSYSRDHSYDGLEEIMKWNDACYLAALAIAHQRKMNYVDVIKGLDSFKELNYQIQNNTELTRALDTTDTSEFVPTQFSANLLDDVRLQLKVAALFQRLSLPRSPFTNPIRGTRQVAYLVGESTSDTSSKIPTSDPISANVTFTAIKFAVRNLFSDELAEDSIVPILPWVRSELVQAMADAEEDAVINGDSTDSTHMHSDVTSANDRRKAFDGLLYHSARTSGNAAVDISTLSTANLRSIRKKMGRFGVNPNELAWITSVSGYVQMLSITEVLTVDKIGDRASIISGQMGSFDGAPVIVSEFSRSDLNTSGVYDGATVTDTNILLAHTPAFLFGDVGAAKAEADRDIETQQTIVVTSRRTSFKQIHTPSGTSEETVGIGYSLTA